MKNEELMASLLRSSLKCLNVAGLLHNMRWISDAVGYQGIYPLLPVSSPMMSHGKPLLLMSWTRAVYLSSFLHLLALLNVEFESNSKFNKKVYGNSGRFAFAKFFDITKNFRAIIRMEVRSGCFSDVSEDVFVASCKPSLFKGYGTMIEDIMESGVVLTKAGFFNKGFSRSLQVDFVIQSIA